MTPELKTACEVVFQEHKASSQIKWNRDAFRGRISIGLSEMAKETLVRKNIIILPNKSKKIITLLNPAVAGAANFEEAEEMIENKVEPVVAAVPAKQPTYIVHQVAVPAISYPEYSHRLSSIAGKPEIRVDGIKWYMKPLFYYVVWPVCALVAGALLSWLIDFTYTKIFLDLK